MYKKKKKKKKERETKILTRNGVNQQKGKTSENPNGTSKNWKLKK